MPRQKKMFVLFLSAFILTLEAHSRVLSEEACYDVLSTAIMDSELAKDDLNERSKELTRKMTVPTVVAAIMSGAVLGPLGATASALPIGLAKVRDKVTIKKIMNTFHLFEMAKKISTNTQIQSEDYKKLRLFYKVKQKVKDRLLKLDNDTFTEPDSVPLEDIKLASSIIDQIKTNNFQKYSFCSINSLEKEYKIEVNPLGPKLIKGISVHYHEFSKNSVQ